MFSRSSFRRAAVALVVTLPVGFIPAVMFAPAAHADADGDNGYCIEVPSGDVEPGPCTFPDEPGDVFSINVYALDDNLAPAEPSYPCALVEPSVYLCTAVPGFGLTGVVVNSGGTGGEAVMDTGSPNSVTAPQGEFEVFTASGTPVVGGTETGIASNNAP